MDNLENVVLSEIAESLNTSPSAKERPPVADYVRRWGGSSSITLLDPSCKIFTIPQIEGAMGFRLESNCAIVFGDPLCDPNDTPLLVEAFHNFCREKGWHIVYITVSEQFALWAIKNGCGSLVEVGEELILDPHDNLKSGSKGRALRNRLNNALRAGIRVHEYVGSDAKLESAIEEVGKAWLDARRGPQIYLIDVELFAHRSSKRWFYAQHEGRIVGVLILHRLDARQGWLLYFSMIVPEAPSGTSEQLVMSAIKVLRKEGCHFLSFGVVQAEELGEIRGINVFSEWIARKVFKLAKWIFRLDKRRRYWRKFRPKKEYTYLLFSEAGIRLREVLAVMRAFNAHSKNS